VSTHTREILADTDPFKLHVLLPVISVAEHHRLKAVITQLLQARQHVGIGLPGALVLGQVRPEELVQLRLTADGLPQNLEQVRHTEASLLGEARLPLPPRCEMLLLCPKPGLAQRRRGLSPNQAKEADQRLRPPQPCGP
jgi:hypothetical protein